jgi:predicted phosphohydrolase
MSLKKRKTNHKKLEEAHYPPASASQGGSKAIEDVLRDLRLEAEALFEELSGTRPMQEFRLMFATASRDSVAW